MSMTEETSELADPFTTEMIDVDNADHLIDALERVKAKQESLAAWRMVIEEAITRKARHEAKTERVCGERRQVVIEFPGISFDQKTLKRLWEEKPHFAKQYLRIESVGVQKREYDKLHRMSGPAEQEEFRRELMAAERPSGSRPFIKIER
jgi:stress response protein YsnF